MRRFVWAALLGSAAVLVAADAAQAQISFGFGRGRGWGGGRDSWYVDTPYFSYGRGYSPYWGSGFYGAGYGYGRYGYGWDGWGSRGYPYRGFSVNVGTPSYYSYPGYGYSYPGYSYSFPSSGYSMSSMSYPVSQAGYRTGGSSDMQVTGMSSENRALVQVMLPNPDAELWFEDSSTEQKGFHRVFISPELEPGKKYTYHVKARWMENGREVTREKEIDVRAGKETAFAFGEREDDGRSGVRSAEYTERDPGRAGAGERRDAEIRTEADRSRPRETDARETERDRDRQPERPQDRNAPPSAAPGNNPPPP